MKGRPGNAVVCSHFNLFAKANNNPYTLTSHSLWQRPVRQLVWMLSRAPRSDGKVTMVGGNIGRMDVVAPSLTVKKTSGGAELPRPMSTASSPNSPFLVL